MTCGKGDAGEAEWSDQAAGSVGFGFPAQCWNSHCLPGPKEPGSVDHLHMPFV